MPYARKGKRTMRKRTAKPYRRTYTKKKFGKTGFFKVVRWSTFDAGNQCHIQLGGNDLLPSQDGATLFKLNNVAGSGELVSLFDNYRIVKVLYRWVITRNPDEVITAANKGIYPRIVWAHDFNDSIPITRQQLYQRSGLREVYFSDNMQKTRWYSLRPAVQSRVYETISSDAFTPKWRQWIDTSEDNAPHYAIKFSADQNYSGMAIRLEAKLVIECKGIS